MYPDQVAKTREAQEAPVAFTTERAARMRTAEIYVRQRYRWVEPDPNDERAQAITRWVVRGGTRPW